jgi:uncharacterized membrane protein YraQ (UPF0718 family)
MNIYAIITIIFAICYGLIFYLSANKLKELKELCIVPSHWTGGTNVKQLKQLIEETADSRIRAKAKQVITLINLSKYMMYGIFLIYILLMAVGV